MNKRTYARKKASMKKISSFRKDNKKSLKSLSEGFCIDLVKENYAEKTWLKNAKSNSDLINCLLYNQKLLDVLNINADIAVKTLSSIYNFLIVSFGVKGANKEILLPDRFLCDRIEVSRYRLIDIITFLGNIGFLTYSWRNYNVFIRLNYNRLNEDAYFKYKALSFCATDIKTLQKYESSMGPYYSPLTKETKKKLTKRDILGLALASVLNFAECEKSYCGYRYNNKYDKQPIIYFDVDLKVVANLTGTSESNVRSKLKILAKTTNYIARHNKVYADEAQWRNNAFTRKFKNKYKYIR